MKYQVLVLILAAALLFSGCADRRQQTPPEPTAQTDAAPPDQQEETPADQEGDPLEFEGTVVSHKPEREEPGTVENSQGQGDFLLLVNSTHPLPENFNIDLAVVQGEYRVDRRILEPAQKMIADAKADGIDLLVCSAYRPVDSQTRLFNNKVAEYVSAGKSEEEATVLTSAIIAVPGTSEHHTGLAMDIVTPAYQNLDEGFAETSAFAWLDKHAADYGFILRYPADKEEQTGIIYESWHYRYVGPEIAKEIKEKGLCLEEYLGELS